MFTVYKFKKSVLEISSIEALGKNQKFWIDLSAPSAEDLEKVQPYCQVDTQTLIRLIDENENPHIEQPDSAALLTFKAPHVTDGNNVNVVSFCIIVTTFGIVTLHKLPIAGIEKLQSSLVSKQEHFSSVSQLVHQIMHFVTQSYTKLAQNIEQDLDALEDRISDYDDKIMLDIFKAKKVVTFFNKSLKANRDVIEVIADGRVKLIQRSHSFTYLLHDYSQLIQGIDTYRVLVQSLAELQSTINANNINVSIKQMTVYSTIVLIPTFIASIYGMNFVYMPEITWRYGYVFVWGVMIFSVIFVWFFFKHKKWM